VVRWIRGLIDRSVFGGVGNGVEREDGVLGE
jgi:hypothetical protein